MSKRKKKLPATGVGRALTGADYSMMQRWLRANQMHTVEIDGFYLSFLNKMQQNKNFRHDVETLLRKYR